MSLWMLIIAVVVVTTAFVLIGRSIKLWWPILRTRDRVVFAVGSLVLVCGAVLMLIESIRNLE